MSKMSKRSFILLLTLIFMLAMISGCGGQAEPATTTAASGGATTTTTASDSTNTTTTTGESETEKDPVVLGAFIPGTGANDLATYNLVAENMGPDMDHVTMEFTQIPWGEYFTKLNVAFSGGTAPDLFGVGLGQIGPVQDSGNMKPLTPLLADWDGWEDIPANVLEIASKDGVLFGMPMLEMRVLFYRVDMFAEAGLDRPPETLKELEEYARKLVKTDAGQITVSGLNIGTGEQTLFTVMQMFNAHHFWNEDLTSAMLEDEAIEALEWCRTLMVERISDHAIMHSIEGGMFENGVAAMELAGSAGLNQIISKVGAENVAVAKLPTEYYMTGVTCWSVYNHTSYPEEALGFWKSIASPEGQLIIAEKIGFVPTRTSVKDDYIAMNPDFNEVFFHAASNAKQYGVMNKYFFDFVNNIRPLIDEVYYGNKTPVEAMTEFGEIYEAAKAASD